MKCFLRLLFLVLMGVNVLDAQPTIDGNFEGEGVWGSPIATADGAEGWATANAKKLYLTEDATYYYMGADIKASEWMAWAFIINTTSGGGSTDSWARSIDYVHCDLPDFDVRGHFGGYGEFHTWNTGWSSVVLNNMEFGENIVGDEKDGWVEARISKLSLGSPASIDVQFYITGDNNNHGSFDACPDDDNAISWDESGNRSPLNIYHTTSTGPAVSVVPALPSDNESLTITFNAACTPLEGAMKVYFHAGVSTIESNEMNFSRTVGNWGQDDGIGLMSSTGTTDEWEITINGARNYFGVKPEEDVFGLNFLFRNADGSLKEDDDGSNYFNDINTSPYFTITSPIYNPAFIQTGSDVTISTMASTASVTWMLEELNPVDSSFISVIPPGGTGMFFNHDILITTTTPRLFKVKADFGGGVVKFKYQQVTGYDPINDAPRPGGMDPGIHYIDANTVTLILHAPTHTIYKKGDGTVSGMNTTTSKAVVHVIGDFNNWTPSEAYKLYRDTDNDGDDDEGDYWWITLTGLNPGQEYIFQYLIDGHLQVADPYCEKISDPDDGFINSDIYPGLIAYPDQADDRASVFQTDQAAFSWTAPSFTKPTTDRLNIYELHFRDFTSDGTYLAAIEKLDYIKSLGINAIHVMPVSEFEGNSSWGYNPNFYFAPDKAYGTKDDLKRFIDECHKREIQVFNDLVLNHSFYSNVMARMWWNEEGNRPLAENPFFNEYHKMVASPDGWWGADWNHESEHVQKMVDRVLDFWIQEYKFDGFRFDFTKGFGQTAQDSGDPWASTPDADRVLLLKRMVDGMWLRNPGSVAIFEHLAWAIEDSELGNHGILLWSGVGHHNDMKEFILGYQGQDIYGSGHYQGGGRTLNNDKANWMSYAESHDEQRLGYEVKNFADVVKQETDTSEQTRLMIDRLKIASAFNLLFPGPRMIWQFQELGYEVDINYNGRTGEKPVRWWYYNNKKRKELYSFMSKLLQVRNDYDLYNSGSSPDYGNIGNGSALLSDPRYMKFDMGGDDYVMVVANLDPRMGHNYTAGFPIAGDWYRYNGDPLIDGTTITASSSIELDSSEVFLFTSFPLDDCKNVSKTIDASVPNTLRSAIGCAVDGDTLTFDFEVSSDTIRVHSTLIVDKNIVIQAHPGQEIVIDGSTINGNVINVTGGKSVELRGVVIDCGNSVIDPCVKVDNGSELKVTDILLNKQN